MQFSSFFLSARINPGTRPKVRENDELDLRIARQVTADRCWATLSQNPVRSQPRQYRDLLPVRGKCVFIFGQKNTLPASRGSLFLRRLSNLEGIKQGTQCIASLLAQFSATFDNIAKKTHSPFFHVFDRLLFYKFTCGVAPMSPDAQASKLILEVYKGLTQRNFTEDFSGFFC